MSAVSQGKEPVARVLLITSADSPNINSVRPYLGFNAFTGIQSAFDSNFHSLQTHLRKNFGAAGLIGLTYMWSKTLTDNGSDRSNAPQNSYNWHEGEYGPYPGDRASRPDWNRFLDRT